MKDEVGYRPRTSNAVLVALVSVAVMIWLRFLVYPDSLIPLTYALALLPSLWHRHRSVHWGLACVFILMATIKVHFTLGEDFLPSATLWSFWGMQALNILAVAAVVDAVNYYRSGMEAEQAKLARANAELEASNEELAASEEEVSRQNEELLQQAQELQQQTEELEGQSEELRAGNEELSKREETLQLLLDVSGAYEDQEETIRRICDLTPELIGAGDAAAVLLSTGENMQMIASSGFGSREHAVFVPTSRSVGALIMERRETGFLEDISLRPDLELPASAWDRPFTATLVSPMTVFGETVGVLEVYSFEPRTWTADHVRMLEWLARQGSKVLETLRLTQQRQQAEEALRRLNEELEKQVVERTALAEERAVRLRALASELAQTEQRERRRLAKLLHDHLQQNLVAAKLHANLLQRPESTSEKGRSADMIDQLLREAIETSRTLTVELSPAVLHDGGLAAGLEWLARAFKEKHGLQVDLQTDAGADTTDEDVSVFVFEAVRELLFNVIKHAGVKRACVSLGADHGNAMIVEVNDRGRGFSIGDKTVTNLAGFGLFGIQQRIESLGGEFSLFTSPEQGTRVELRVPLPRRLHAERSDESRFRAQGKRNRPGTKDRPASDAGIGVLLVDDHAIVRQGLSMLLKREAGIHVIGEAADGESALRAVRLLRPQVVVMDVGMPGMDGIKATSAITSEFPEVRVIALSMFEEADRADAMLKAGAQLYLNKDGPSEKLIAAIRHQGALATYAGAGGEAEVTL